MTELAEIDQGLIDQIELKILNLVEDNLYNVIEISEILVNQFSISKEISRLIIWKMVSKKVLDFNSKLYLVVN